MQLLPPVSCVNAGKHMPTTNWPGQHSLQMPGRAPVLEGKKTHAAVSKVGSNAPHATWFMKDAPISTLALGARP